MAEPLRAHAAAPQLAGGRILIVEARYYDAIGAMLFEGARAAIEKAGASCEVVGVPGALEIPAGSPSRSMRRARRGALTTAPWRSAASSAARPSISRSSPANPRAR